jgi:transposase-like protein
MSKFAQVGDFCPNKICPDHGKLQSEHQQNIIRFGRTKAGRQRFRCNTCGGTFTESKGTIFYRRRTPEDEIIETLALVAEGRRISSLVRVKGHKEDTILAWIRDAAEHAEAIEEVLLADYQLERCQLDGLWAYVGNKGEKRTTQKPTKAANFGDPP